MKQYDREELLEAAAMGYPIIEDERHAVLIYEGDAASVAVVGDMAQWEEGAAMERAGEGGPFWARFELEPDARIEYLFEIDGRDQIQDPRNRRRSLNGLFGTSELAMPRYEPHPLIEPLSDGRRGSVDGLDEIAIPSARLGYPHVVHVMMPSGRPPEGGFPSVWFQDGRDYLQCAHAPYLIRALVASEAIPPIAAVFVTPPNLHVPAVPNRSTEYGLNGDYVAFFADELAPTVSERYPAMSANASDRLVVGDSYGGLISAAIGLSRRDAFGMAYSQSGYLGFQGGRLAAEAERLGPEGLRILLDVGTYERVVGPAFIPPGETDFLAGNRAMRDALVSAGFDVAYREYSEGHTWGNWRRHLLDALPYFFGTRRGSR